MTNANTKDSGHSYKTLYTVFIYIPVQRIGAKKEKYKYKDKRKHKHKRTHQLNIRHCLNKLH